MGEAGGPPVTALALSADGKFLATIERGDPYKAVILDLATADAGWLERIVMASRFCRWRVAVDRDHG